MLPRRHFTGLILISAVAACSTPPTPSQLATDTSLIASGLSAAIASIAAIPGVSPATVSQLQGYLATIEADATTVAAATVTTPTNIVEEIAQTVQAVASVALPLIPGGTSLVALINAAVSLVPTILAAVGVSGAAPAGPLPYTPAQARLILAAAR
jgi:hypothetical protein